MKKKWNKIILALVVMMCVLTACDDEKIERNTSDTMLLFYMLPDKALSSHFEANIADIKDGYNGEGNILIIKASPNADPCLYRIERVKKDGKSIWTEKLVKEYPQLEGKTHLPEVMRGLIEEAKEMYPAKRCGLILSSHGSGWIPEGNGISTLSFGPSENMKMNIDDIVKGIPDNTFEFIAFDACFMASVEVAYALRNKAQWYIASTMEIWAKGFPYKTMINHLMSMGSIDDYKKACDSYYDSYVNDGGGTISLIDLSKLEMLRKFMSHLTNLHLEQLPMGIFEFTMNRPSLIRNSYAYKFFDMYHFIKMSCNEDIQKEFKSYLDESVVYVRSTDTFGTTPLDNNCGLSFYYPSMEEKDINFKGYQYDYYKSLEWSVDFNWEKFNH